MAQLEFCDGGSKTRTQLAFPLSSVSSWGKRQPWNDGCWVKFLSVPESQAASPTRGSVRAARFLVLASDVTSDRTKPGNLPAHPQCRKNSVTGVTHPFLFPSTPPHPTWLEMESKAKQKLQFQGAGWLPSGK